MCGVIHWEGVACDDCWSEDTTMTAAVGLNAVEFMKQNFEKLVPICCFFKSQRGGRGETKEGECRPRDLGKGGLKAVLGSKLTERTKEAQDLKKLETKIA